MPRDYRKRSGSKKGAKSNISLVVLGVIVGLILAAVFYWNQTAPPESAGAAHAKKAVVSKKIEKTAKVDKAVTPVSQPEFDFYTVLPQTQGTLENTNNKPAESTKESAAQPTQAVPQSGPTGVTAQPIEGSVETATPTTTEKPAPIVEKSIPENSVLAPTTTPVEKILPEKKTPSQSDIEGGYLLQMASLKNYGDADRLKAQLALLGFDAHIQPYRANKQLYHRVVMGPFSSKESALKQQTKLQKNHVPSILIKAR